MVTAVRQVKIGDIWKSAFQTAASGFETKSVNLPRNEGRWNWKGIMAWTENVS